MRLKAGFFDMDGTLIAENSWDMLYQELGLAGSPWLKDYAAGRITYKELFLLDLQYWIKKRGPISRAFVEGVASRVTILPEARELFRRLRESGVRTIIVTAGLKEFAERVRREIGADEAFYNELIYDDDGFCRGMFIDRVDPRYKWRIVEAVLRRDGLKKEESFSVGDTHYDESMFRATGISFILDGPEAEGVSGAIRIKSLMDIINYLQ